MMAFLEAGRGFGGAIKTTVGTRTNYQGISHFFMKRRGGNQRP